MPWLQGKVRDTYDLGDKLVIVTTDRQSAFDRLLAAIPFKGQVLNQTAAWWMQQTSHIVPNALLAGVCGCGWRGGLLADGRLASRGGWLWSSSACIKGPRQAPPRPAVPDPNACIMRKCSVFPVEFVVRGFMTGEGAAGRQGRERGEA
jgi:phosphoribosylaminoimidazole-succinocarboxamide synthase